MHESLSRHHRTQPGFTAARRASGDGWSKFKLWRASDPQRYVPPRESEQRIVIAAMQAIAPAVLRVGPDARQVGDEAMSSYMIAASRGVGRMTTPKDPASGIDSHSLSLALFVAALILHA